MKLGDMILRIQSTSEINSTILLSAGMDCRTVETMICRFFRNLGADVIANVSAQSLPWKLHLALMWQHAECKGCLWCNSRKFFKLS